MKRCEEKCAPPCWNASTFAPGIKRNAVRLVLFLLTPLALGCFADGMVNAEGMVFRFWFHQRDFAGKKKGAVSSALAL